MIWEFGNPCWVYTTDVGGVLYRVDWVAPSTLGVTYSGKHLAVGPANPQNNNRGSTPCMDVFGQVYYLDYQDAPVPDTLLVQYDSQAGNWTGIRSANGPVATRFSSPTASTMNGMPGNVIFYQAGDGFRSYWFDSLYCQWYDNVQPNVFGVHCAAQGMEAVTGSPNMAVVMYPVLDANLVECYRCSVMGPGFLETQYRSVPIQGTCWRGGSVTVLDDTSLVWFGHCVTATDRLLCTLKRDPGWDPHNKPIPLIVQDSEEMMPHEGAFCSPTAVMDPNNFGGQRRVYAVRISYAGGHGPDTYQLGVWQIDANLNLSDPWLSAPWVGQHDGSTPAVDGDGFAYVTTTETIEVWDGQDVIEVDTNKLKVFDPLRTPNGSPPVYEGALTGELISSSPTIGLDGRVYVTTDAGDIYAFWEP